MIPIVSKEVPLWETKLGTSMNNFYVMIVCVTNCVLLDVMFIGLDYLFTSFV